MNIKEKVRFNQPVPCMTGTYTNPHTGLMVWNGCRKWQCSDCGQRLEAKLAELFESISNVFNYCMTVNLVGDKSASRENASKLDLKPVLQWLRRNAELKEYLWCLGYGVREGLHKHLALNLSYWSTDSLLHEIQQCVARSNLDLAVHVELIRNKDAWVNYLTTNYREAARVLSKDIHKKGCSKELFKHHCLTGARGEALASLYS